MPADFEILAYPVERLNTSNLLLKWKEITNVLVSRGKAAALCQELDSRTCYEDSLRSRASKSVSQLHERSRRESSLSNTAHISTNGTKIDKPTDESASPDDGWTSVVDESDSNIEIFDTMGVPPYLIIEAADLSQYKHANSSPGFKNPLAHEHSLAQYNNENADLNDLPQSNNDLTMSSGMSPYALTIPPSEIEENQWQPIGGAKDREQNTPLKAKEHDIVDVTQPVLLPQMPLPRRHNSATLTRGLRLSEKRNLVPTEIPMVADVLISQDAISYFLHHCHSIYESLMTLSSRQSLGHGNSLETSFVSAVDSVKDLLEGNRVNRLLLRFAYFQLQRCIDAYKKAAAADRGRRKGGRRRGHRDATVAISMYLKTKQKTSGEEMKRSQLLGYCRTGRRWAILAGESPLLMFIFSHVADTIV